MCLVPNFLIPRNEQSSERENADEKKRRRKIFTGQKSKRTKYVFLALSPEFLETQWKEREKKQPAFVYECVVCSLSRLHAWMHPMMLSLRARITLQNVLCIQHAHDVDWRWGVAMRRRCLKRMRRGIYSRSGIDWQNFEKVINLDYVTYDMTWPKIWYW